MCAGAIINSRIRRVIYAVADQKAGCCGSVTDLFALPFNHRPQVTAGVCAEECAALVQEFFTKLREELKTRPRWKKPAVETGTDKRPAAKKAKAASPADDSQEETP